MQAGEALPGDGQREAEIPKLKNGALFAKFPFYTHQMDTSSTCGLSKYDK